MPDYASALPRTPEPELMTGEEQALAYAQANFEEAHRQYPILFAEVFPGPHPPGIAIDLGCGPGDITIRFARAFPGFQFDALDGSPAMLACGRQFLARHPDVAGRIRFVEGFLPDAPLPHAPYDLILSNNLLHHLHDPQVLWQTIRRCQKPGSLVFVTDLRRPASEADVVALTARYAAGEPPVLQLDYANSLRAAFTPNEVTQQLQLANLDWLSTRVTSDRHFIVVGRAP